MRLVLQGHSQALIYLTKMTPLVTSRGGGQQPDFLLSKMNPEGHTNTIPGDSLSRHIPTAAWPGLHPLPPPQRLWRVLSRPGLVCIPCHAAASKLAHGHLATTTKVL